MKMLFSGEVFGSFHDESDSVPSNVYRFRVALGFGIAFALIVHVSVIPVFVWLGLITLAWIKVASVALLGASYWFYRHGRLTAALIPLTGAVVFDASASVWNVGWTSGFHHYVIVAAFVLFLHPTLSLLIRIVGVALLLLAYLALFSLVDVLPTATAKQAIVFNYVNSALMFVLVCGMAAYWSRAAHRTEQRIERTNKLLEDLASTDPLTGLLNRRRMLERLQQAATVADQSGEPTTVLLADIDDFKAFNDIHGHICGDYVLEGMAKVLRTVLRQGDQAARWGGEEFLILLPDTGVADAARVAERIRLAVETERFCYGSEPLQVTLTFGLSQYRHGEPIGDCIGRADDALLAGKRLRKNSVHITADEPDIVLAGRQGVAVVEP